MKVKQKEQQEIKLRLQGRQASDFKDLECQVMELGVVFFLRALSKVFSFWFKKIVV
jgi:hypothetical protein